MNKGKCWLIVKNQDLEEKARELFGETINITTEGRRLLGAVIGSKEFKDSYCEEKINKWSEEAEDLCLHTHSKEKSFRMDVKLL